MYEHHIPSAGDFATSRVDRWIVKIGDNDPQIYFVNGSLRGADRVALSPIRALTSAERDAVESAQSHAKALGSVSATVIEPRRFAARWVRPDTQPSPLDVPAQSAHDTPHDTRPGSAQYTAQPRLAFYTDESYHEPKAGQYNVVRIEENTPGYQYVTSFGSLDAASQFADERNQARGLTREDVLEIVASSMAAHNAAKYGDPGDPGDASPAADRMAPGTDSPRCPCAWSATGILEWPSEDCTEHGHIARAEARAEAPSEAPSEAQSEGTVDPDRQIPAAERLALVTIEVAERVARLAMEALSDTNLAGDQRIARANHYLDELIERTTTRTATAVKRQDLSDRISGTARDQVARIRTSVESMTGPLEDAARTPGPPEETKHDVRGDNR